MAERLVILSPLDLKRGSISPTGQVVQKATLYVNEGASTIVAQVVYEGGAMDALMWPSGIGWTVDGKVGA